MICNITDDSDDESGNYGSRNFTKGKKYILVNTREGTTDIACDEILGGNGDYDVKDILAPSEGLWGSCYIDNFQNNKADFYKDKDLWNL